MNAIDWFSIVPSILDCGSCLIGDVKEWSISCENSGGEGRFRFMLGDIIDEDVIVEVNVEMSTYMEV